MLNKIPAVDEQINKPLTVIIREESYLRILGTTNVNTFSCGYQGLLNTDTLTVNMQQTEDKLLLDHAVLNTKISHFDCGNTGINKDFRELLQAEDFPLIKVELLSLIKAHQDKHQFLANIAFEIAGQKEMYVVTIKQEEENGETYYTGNQTLNIIDFGLVPPRKFLGMIVVDEEVLIDFKLYISEL